MSEHVYREEWTYAHSQGIHPGPFTERQARAAIAANIMADQHRQLRMRGKQRLLRRLVTDWEEVPLAPTTPPAPESATDPSACVEGEGS